MKKNENTVFQATCFQLHKSLLIETDLGTNIIDFTEKKLLKQIEACSDSLKKLLLSVMLEDYKRGSIAISWRNGKATYTRVTIAEKNNSCSF